MKIMAGLIRRARPATEVMWILAVEGAKWQGLFDQTGRNNLCPCGSGRKYKQCHGQPAAKYPLKPAPISRKEVITP